VLLEALLVGYYQLLVACFALIPILLHPVPFHFYLLLKLTFYPPILIFLHMALALPALALQAP
jgi:hypothetical protein